MVGGVMPDASGVEHAIGEAPIKHVFHKPLEIVTLLVTAVLSKVGATALETLIIQLSQHMEEEHPRRRWLLLRLLTVLSNTLHKMCGWLLLFSVGWTVHKGREFTELVNLRKKSADDSVQVRAITSVICSYLSFLGIIALDCLPGSPVGRFKCGILQSLSMMVGFSWRRCYGLSIDFVSGFAGHIVFPNASNTADGQDDGELILEILIGIPVALIVMPALCWYISPMVLLADMTDAATVANPSPAASSASLPHTRATTMCTRRSSRLSSVAFSRQRSPNSPATSMIEMLPTTTTYSCAAGDLAALP
eukprot:TRINITY_DN45280_c0_g1_i1.p1 TRINITY_DN45280_c0_g1~~TRINITY_DN45280_c0_g1_i1.p1  ORF type:complete len:306 (-),score=26.49 TRINITY_DN45280_c0_g1_i1:527-1444(-)